MLTETIDSGLVQAVQNAGLAASTAVGLTPCDPNHKPPVPPKTSYRPKKLRKTIGPMRTPCTFFERGKEREIDITISGFHLEFRLKGLPGVYRMTMEQALMKAMATEANFETTARTGRLRRGIGGV